MPATLLRTASGSTLKNTFMYGAGQNDSNRTTKAR